MWEDKTARQVLAIGKDFRALAQGVGVTSSRLKDGWAWLFSPGCLASGEGGLGCVQRFSFPDTVLRIVNYTSLSSLDRTISS